MNQNRPILFEEGLMKVRWEDMYIDIPFDFGNTHEIIFYKVIRGMQSQIDTLSKELESLKEGQKDYIRFKFQTVSDKEAEFKIASYLKEIKSKTPQITLFQISQNLKLPADQVEKVIEKLSEEGRIKWVEQ